MKKGDEDKKPLPQPIPLARIIAPFLFISFFAAWYMCRLNEVTPVEKNTIGLPSLLKQDEIICEWPRFALWDGYDAQNATFVRSIECPSTQPSFASLDAYGYLAISAPFSTTIDYSETRCSYRPLSPSNTAQMMTQIALNSRVKARDDQFVVTCMNGTETIYEEAFFNPTARLQAAASRAVRGDRKDEGEKYKPTDPMSPSVAVILIDDVSKEHFARSLPKTMSLMREEDFFVPTRYSQSYSDAAANLDLILNGNDSTSLVERMRDRGCLTFTNEEAGEDTPVFPEGDIDTRQIHVFNRQRQENDYCLANGKSPASSVLEPLLAFSSSHRHLCSLSLTRLRSPHDKSLLGSIDDELSSALAQLISTSSNTAVFVISPSGLRGKGLAGIVEGKSPLLAAWFPAEFRRVQNRLYSAFAWNMDKLITTRDVSATLRELAEGSLPDFALWRDWDEEHEQASSLLGEMLPEERNCSTMNIPAENCLCLGADKQRNATVNAEGILFDRVFSFVETRALQQPCIDGIEVLKGYTWISAYRLFEKEEEKEADDLEWLTINFYVRVAKRHLIHGGNYGAGGEDHIWLKTMVRHYRSSGRLEYVEAVIGASFECFAVHLERICSLCYSQRFWSLSAPGPNKGFLLDTANAMP